MAWIVKAIGRCRAKTLSCIDAADLLGISERHFRRLRDAYEEKGAEGLIDKRRGRASGRRAPVDEIEWVLEQFRTRYFDFTAKHFHEAIQGEKMPGGAKFARSYTWTKSVLQLRGLTTKAKKRGRIGGGASGARCRGCWCSRTPRPTLGWKGAARSTSSRRWTMRRAAFCRSSSSNRKERRRAFAGSGRRSRLTDCSRASTPTAAAIISSRPRRAARWIRRGRRRSGGRWRSWGSSTSPPTARRDAGGWSGCGAPLQKRLPPLLRQGGFGADVEAANQWLASLYMAQHNARFSVEAAEDGNAFVPLAGPLVDILCVEEERVVGHDNTVRYEGRVLQIPQARHRHHFVNAKVKVREYADGSPALFHGPRRTADYDAAGSLLQGDENKQKSAA